MDYLTQFPRPLNDTKVGVHFPPTQYLDASGIGTDWDSVWKNRIESLGIKWAKVLDDGSGSSLKTIIRLRDQGIMPIVRMYRQEPNPERINGGVLNYIKLLISCGVVYFETNNEPDLSLEWKNGKRPENWLEIVVDNFIIEASQVRDMGGYLLFPAFGPGGRGNPFEMIVDRGRKDLLDGNCCLAVHNYCLCRPLDYPNDSVNMTGKPMTQEEWDNCANDKKDGNGSMWANEMSVEAVNALREKCKNPDANILNDSTCFRAYEYFDKLVNDAVDHSIPQFMTEGGFNVGQRAGTTFGDDGRYPKQGPEENAIATMGMFSYKTPDYWFGMMPWIIAVKESGGWQEGFENQGPWWTWQFNADWHNCAGQLPIVKKMQTAKETNFSPIIANGPLPPNWDKYPGDIDIDGDGNIALNHFDEFDARAYNWFKETSQSLNEAENYEVDITPIIDPEGEIWQPIGVRHLTGDENKFNHHVYISMLNENGKYIGPLSNAVGWTWIGREENQIANPVELKARPERGNIGMDWGQTVTVWGLVDGLESGMVGNIHTRWPDENENNRMGHHSYHVVFLRTGEGSGDGNEPPDGGNSIMLSSDKPGIWVANGDPGNTKGQMLGWGPGALTCFDEYIGPNDVFMYKALKPETPIIIRFQHPMNWWQDLERSSTNIANRVVSKWPEIKHLNPYIYFANEMNLHYENGDQNPGNQHLYTTPEFYEKFGGWVRLTADKIKQQVPEMLLVTPPFAFGHNEDGEPDDNGNPKLGWAGYDYLWETIRDYFNNVLTFHAYWGNAGGSVHDWLYDEEKASWYAFRWQRVLKLFESRYGLDCKMIIDEAGNFAVTDSDFTDQIIYYAQKTLKDERVLALTYFLWTDPTNSPGNVLNSWQQNMDADKLAAHLYRLSEFSLDGGPVDPDPDPEPEPEPETKYKVNITYKAGGLALITGNYPKAGVPILVQPPYGPSWTVISGSKGEFGAGGFEAGYANQQGNYRLTIESSEYIISCNADGKSIKLSFEETGGDTDTIKLVSVEMSQADADYFINKYPGIFQVVTPEITASIVNRVKSWLKIN